jgi:hypothetical protein
VRNPILGQRNDFATHRAPIQLTFHDGDPVNSANIVAGNTQVKEWSAIKIVKSENAVEAEFFTEVFSPA